jgi:hypothetical protein
LAAKDRSIGFEKMELNPLRLSVGKIGKVLRLRSGRLLREKKVFRLTWLRMTE